jgi:hypothetical protein
VTYLSSWYSAQHGYCSRNSLTCKWIVATACAHGVCHLTRFLTILHTVMAFWKFRDSWAPMLICVILVSRQRSGRLRFKVLPDHYFRRLYLKNRQQQKGLSKWLKW